MTAREFKERQSLRLRNVITLLDMQEYAKEKAWEAWKGALIFYNGECTDEELKDFNEWWEGNNK